MSQTPDKDKDPKPPTPTAPALPPPIEGEEENLPNLIPDGSLISQDTAAYRMEVIARYGQYLIQLAEHFAKSRFFPTLTNPADVLVILETGLELGLMPAESMTGIHIIDNQPVVGAPLLAAAVMRSPHFSYRVESIDYSQCSIDFTAHGENVGRSTFTTNDAAVAKLLGKRSWVRYRRNLLFARAMRNGVTWYVPGLAIGVSAPAHALDMADTRNLIAGPTKSSDGCPENYIPAGQVDPTTTPEAQLREDIKLLTDDAGVEITAILAWAKVDSMEELTVEQLISAVHKLQKTIEQAEKARKSGDST